jgi:hypothetical protein
MAQITNKAAPKLRKSPQPPLSYLGATPDSDRAKQPPLAGPSATGEELNPGDRAERVGNFGKPPGELDTVEQTNEVLGLRGQRRSTIGFIRANGLRIRASAP